MRKIKFKAAHLIELVKLEKNARFQQYLSPEHLEHLESYPHILTLMVGERVMAVAGVSSYWAGRGEVWAVIGEHSRPESLAIFRAIRTFIDECPFRRIEASVELGFEPGHRCARLLGFKMEAPKMKAFLPWGEDASLYARVREAS